MHASLLSNARRSVAVALLVAVSGPAAGQGLNFTHDASGNLNARIAASSSLPQIVGQPQPQVVALGDVATFSVVLKNTADATFQWRVNDADIGGATSDSYVIPSVVAENAGQYSVVVTRGTESVTSANAALLLDTDGDTLPDIWETTHFGNLAQRATGDFDGDGINNINEYQDGTSPASNAAYRPRLTVLTDGGGVVNVAPLKPSYDLGEVVTLTAVANPLHAFRGWSGALASQTSPETITMTASKAVKAHFIRTPIPTGVVSWWRAENDAVDAIVNNTGTLLNGVAFAPGEVGQAFDFNAANQQLKMDASPTLAVGPGSGLTIEAWIRPADLLEKPIAEWHTGTGNGWGAHFWMSTSFSGLGGAGCLYTNLKDINNGDHYMFSPTGLLIPNVWQHVAVTYDRASGTTRLFRNGVVVASANLGSFVPQTTTNFYLGHRPGTTTFSFSGQMDEPALYNRALTTDEIFALHAGGPAGKDATPYLTSPSPMPDAILNTAYSQQLTANLGTPPLTYSGGFGALPQGLSLSSTGLINGSPTTAGTYYFGLQVGDAIGRSREQPFSLKVLAPLTPPSGTTAWWRGETNAQDSIGTNHATLQNGATYTAGKIGQAFNFNGTNQYVLVPNSATLQSQTLSVDAWVYPRTTGSINDSLGGVIFTKDRGSSPGSQISYGLFGPGNNGRFTAMVQFTDGLNFNIASANGFPLNQWHHVGMTWDGHTLSLYVNGNREATATVSIPRTILYTNDNAGIGGHSFNARLSNSVIDEVTVSNRALSATEMGDIFRAGIAGKKTTGPVINTPGVLSDGYVGQAYSKTISALRTTGGTTYSVAGGSLPTNLTLSPAGVLSGTPTTTGSYSFTIRLSDGSPVFAEQSFTFAIYSPQPPSAGLVSWWRAENNANDAITLNHGALTNGATFGPGKVGQAFALDGANDYVTVPDSASLQPTSLTLEGWFNFSSVGGNPHLFTRTVGTSFYNSFVIWLNGTILRAGVGDAVGGGNGVSVPFTPVVGQWYHIAFTFDNNAQRAALYLDGALIGTNVAAGTVVYDNHPVLLGADIDSGNVGNFFNGRIDEAAIHSRALNAAEVASVYNSGSAGRTVTGPYFDIAGTLPEAILRSPYSQTITTSRGTSPITFSLAGGALPPGITLNTSDGLLSGTPTTAGNFTFALRATDTGSLSSDQTFTLRVLPLVPPPAGIIAWWRAQSDAQDSVGTNHGTLTNGATFAAGKTGNAFSFDGVDDGVTIPAINAGSKFSVEFWLFPTRSAGYEHLVSNSGGSANYGDLYFRDNHIEYWQGGVQRLSSATSTILLFSWSHVAMTFENGMNRLYINGELAGASAIHGETFNNPLAFGYTNAPSNNRFKGRIDEISLYNRALNQEEISSVFGAGSAGKTTSGPYINLASIPAGTVDLIYSQTITSLRGTGQLTYSVLSGTLPAGLILNPNGLLSGIPTASGTSTFIVRALDAAGLSADQTFTLTVYPQFRLPLGAVSWWRAEGNANDSLGTNHGTMLNGASFGNGSSSQGFQLDGVDDHVTFPDAPSLRPTSFTIEGWFLFEQATGIQVLIAKPILNSPRDSFAVWLQDGVLNSTVMSPGAEGPRLQFPFTPSLGRWYHIAYTFDNATKQQILFLDTAVAAVGVGTISPGYDASPLVIGADRENNTPAFFHKGAADEVTLYNRPLLANEIASIYQARSAGKRPFSPFDAWKLANLGDPAASSIGDFDFDGVAVLVEYAFGMSPTVSDAALLPQVSMFDYPEGRRPRIIFPRDPARNDITIEVQVSGDLGGLEEWTTIASSVHGAPTTGPGYVGGDGAGAGIKLVEVRDIMNVTDASPPRRFVRFRVSQ